MGMTFLSAVLGPFSWHCALRASLAVRLARVISNALWRFKLILFFWASVRMSVGLLRNASLSSCSGWLPLLLLASSPGLLLASVALWGFGWSTFSLINWMLRSMSLAHKFLRSWVFWSGALLEHNFLRQPATCWQRRACAIVSAAWGHRRKIGHRT